LSWASQAWARRKLSRERGVIYKDWGGRLPVALVYPNAYRTGMSSLGLQILYRLLNDEPDIVCERCFWEPSLLKAGGEPITLEGQRPLSDFAVVAFSVSFELDYLHVVSALRRAGIPLRSEDRDERHPLVIGGGPCLTANPEPVAPAFDAVAVGEGEAILPRMLPVLREKIDGPRAELLTSLAEVPGLYVPNLWPEGHGIWGGSRPPVLRQYVRDLDSHPGSSSLLTQETEFAQMLLLEVARGCARGCRFCLAGYCFRPMRERSLSALLDMARDGLSLTDRVGLMGPAVSDYSRIDDLVCALRSMEAKLSFASLRLDRLTDDLLRAVVESGTRTITLAPEAGSERLRGFLSKTINDREVLAAVERAAQAGLRRVKLYYMLGLPTESEQDADEIVRLTSEVSRALGGGKKRGEVLVTLSPFVPKAQTPFQWEPMLDLETLTSRLRRVQSALRLRGVATDGESPEWSAVQGVLARGDRRLFSVLERLSKLGEVDSAARGRGAVARSSGVKAWREALREEGVEANEYLRPGWTPEAPLPWDKVSSGVDKRFLQRERERAAAGLGAVPCPGSRCKVCGVCGEAESSSLPN